MKQRMLASSICSGILNCVFLKLCKGVWDTAIKPAGIFCGTGSIGQNQHTGGKC